MRPGAYEITLIGPDQNQMTREYTNVNGYGGSVQIRFNPKTTERPRGAISLQRLAHKVPKAAGKEYAKARRERDKKHAAEAERHYLKALELDPQFLEAANDLGALYYTLARYADSLRVLEQARVIEPDSPQVLANLSANLMALGRHGDAEPLARRSMAIDPTSIRTRYLLGLSRMGQRKLDAETRGLLEEASLEIPHAKFALERFIAVSGAR